MHGNMFFLLSWMKPELLKICPEEYKMFCEKMGQRKHPDKIYYNKGL